MINKRFFEDRSLFIVTKHKKERVIAPLLKSEFNISCYVDPIIDTDQFGTFSGEVEREDDPISTLRKKCSLAFKYDDVDLILASEGSFGPHPQLFFTSANEEFLMLLDRKNNLELVVKMISTETNFSATTIKTFEELEVFALEIGFPEHGLVLKKGKDDLALVKKGISNWKDLKEYYDLLKKYSETVFVETDMRALYNPTRMNVIAQCTEKMIELMKSECPKCSFPGFQVTSYQHGLPCGSCGLPTRSTKSIMYTCKKCDYQISEDFPNGKTTEDPTFCDFCNP